MRHPSVLIANCNAPARGWGRQLFAVILAAGLLAPGLAQAGGFPSAFVVADVHVDASADNGVNAREHARLDGETRAFERLLQRLTRQEDWDRLPDLSSDQITDLVQDMEVKNERALPTRYIGSYTFRFNPAGIRRLLDRSGIAYSELASKPVVLVPVLQREDGTHLWDDPNPWRDAWNATESDAGVVPWVVPDGDLTDVQAIDAPDAANPRQEGLQQLSSRYDGGDPVIAAAVETVDNRVPHLKIAMTRYGPSGPETASTSVDGSQDETEKALFAAGVQAAVILLEGQWKPLALAPVSAGSGGEHTLVVTAPISGAAGFARLRSRLGQVPGVESFQLLQLDHGDVRFLLKLAASPEALHLAFAQQNLALSDNPNGATLIMQDGVNVPAANARPGGNSPASAAPAPAPSSTEP